MSPSDPNRPVEGDVVAHLKMVEEATEELRIHIQRAAFKAQDAIAALRLREQHCQRMTEENKILKARVAELEAMASREAGHGQDS